MKRYRRSFAALVLALVMTLNVCAGLTDIRVLADTGGIPAAGNEVATDTDSGGIGNLRAVPSGVSGIKLSWDGCEAAESYRVYVYDTAKKRYIRYGSTQDCEYEITGLKKAGAEYLIAVRGHAEDGSFATDRAEIKARTIPQKADLKENGAHSVSGTYIRWNQVTGAEGYQVYKYNSAQKSWTKLADTKSVTYEDKGLSPATGYIYRVRSYMTYDGVTYYSAFSNALKTATVPRSVKDAVFYEKQVLRRSSSREYSLLKSDAPYLYIRGYKLQISNTNRTTGYVVYYQDVKDRNQADVRKARRLIYTGSRTPFVARSSRKGYERVFWISTYYTYGGKKYINPSKVPVSFGGIHAVYTDKKGKITSIQEKEYRAVDNQLSQIRYYRANGKLSRYSRFYYNGRNFVSVVRTYSSSGRLIKTEKY